jgi:hypothetical protein
VRQIIKNSGKYEGLHSFLLPVFFVLHNYIQYYGLVSVATALKILGELLLFFLCMALLFLFFSRSISKSLLLTTVSGFFILFYGVIKDFFKITLELPFLARYSILLPALLLLMVVLFIHIIRKTDFKRINYFLNLLLFVSIVIDTMVLQCWSSNFFYRQNLMSKQNILKVDGLPATGSRPDVYYLLFDCYPGTDYLREFMGYDNSALDTALTNKGFYVLKNPSSNYHGTALSIASTLNFEYLKGIVPNVPTDSRQYNQAQLSINRAVVPAVFMHQGYKIYNLSIFELAGQPPVYKENFLALPERQVLLYNTVTENIRRDVLWNFITGKLKTPFLQRIVASKSGEIIEEAVAKRNFNNTIIDSLLQIPLLRQGKPKFTYAHFYLPHPPFFYNKNGDTNNIDSVVMPDMMRNKYLFLSYLEYTNKAMLAIVNQILQRSARKPVIIIQGDHGFRDFVNGPVTHELYFKNYSAFYFPDRDYSGLYDSLSNINTFPIIFNKYFNTHIPLQKDSTIF